MKRPILCILFLLVFTMAGAQTIHFGDGSSRTQSDDKIAVIVPNGDMLGFFFESGDSLTVPFVSVDSISWALPTSVASLITERVSIAYDGENQEVVVYGITLNDQEPAFVYDAEGKLVQTATRNRFSVAGYGSGLYIVEIKNKSNAKFMKK